MNTASVLFQQAVSVDACIHFKLTHVVEKCDIVEVTANIL